MRLITRRSLLLLLPALLISLNTSAATLKIAMVLWRGATAAEQAFKTALEARDYTVEYHTFDGQQDRNRLADLLRTQLLPRIDDYDYIYCFGTTVTQMTQRLVKQRGVLIFNAVTEPQVAGIELNDTTAGVSNRVSLAQQMALLKRFMPFSRIGYLFNSREKNSSLGLAALERLAFDEGFSVVPFRVPGDPSRLSQQLRRLAGQRTDIDVLYLPMDSFLLSHADEIGRALLEGGIPAFGAHEDYVRQGAVIGLVPVYAELGELAASIVDEHQSGQSLASIGIQYVETPRIVLNRRALERLNITLSPSLQQENLIVVD